MTKDELIKLCKDKPNIISKILKRENLTLFNSINELKSISGKFTEKLYLYINNESIPVCKNTVCNNNVKFTSISKGYSTYCSNKCASADIKVERYEKIKKTFKDKYNVSSPSQLTDVKNKISKHHKSGCYDYADIQSKAKATRLVRYGSENYNNIEKQRKTKLELYGTESFNNREKFINTLINQYGQKIHPSTKKSMKDRLLNNEIGFNSKKFKNWLKSHAVDNVSQIPSVKEKINIKSINNSYSTITNRIQDVVIPMFEKEDFSGVGYYDVLYEFKCIKCDEVFKDSLYGGNIPRCTSCYPKNTHISIGQYELYDYLKELLPNTDIQLNNTTVLNGKELDIYIPSHNIAIEYNGLYYHSELTGGKDKKYHITKTIECKSKGIRLIHITDFDWFRSIDVIKFRLSHIFKQTTPRIFARNCKIVKLSKTQKSSFLNTYHLQKNDKSQIWIGLEYKGEIITVMTFGNFRKILGSNPINNEYELYRYATKYNVVGGASKLLKHFIQHYNPTKIITYSKLDWGFTDFYEKIGFKFSHITPPNYWYINKGKLIHRSNFQKHKLKNILEVFDPNLTEWENMQLNGYDRIWDCGNLKFEWV